MFYPFFLALRKEGIPVSVTEYLSFLEGMAAGLGHFEVTEVYHLSRTVMVKDERFLDRFDRAFATSFQGLDHISPEMVLEALNLPEEWLRKLAERALSDEEKAQVSAVGGFDALMDALRQRLAEQRERHRAEINGSVRRAPRRLGLTAIIPKEYALVRTIAAISAR
jgi:uncharacterized protein with von Willebrand factor type A (vWA) domain